MILSMLEYGTVISNEDALDELVNTILVAELTDLIEGL